MEKQVNLSYVRNNISMNWRWNAMKKTKFRTTNKHLDVNVSSFVISHAAIAAPAHNRLHFTLKKLVCLPSQTVLTIKCCLYFCQHSESACRTILCVYHTKTESVCCCFFFFLTLKHDIIWFILYKSCCRFVNNFTMNVQY